MSVQLVDNEIRGLKAIRVFGLIITTNKWFKESELTINSKEIKNLEVVKNE